MPGCPNERTRKPKNVFSLICCFLGDSGNWGAVISFWNNTFLCCFEHKFLHAVAT